MAHVRVVIVIYLMSLIFALTLAFINFSDTRCGQSIGRRSRIIGGDSAIMGEYPWIASISLNNVHECGGILINKWWTLSAAHCFHDNSTATKSRARIHVLKDGLLNMVEDVVMIDLILLHPNYKMGQIEYDIALLKHKSELCTPNFMPACFPTLTEAFDGAKVTVAGWGSNNEVVGKGTFPQKLYKVNVAVLENSECERWYHSENEKLTLLQSQMCAGVKTGGKDACWADSGGPLMIETQEPVVVIGVVSFGIGCGRPNLPGIYTKISSFVPWISSILNSTNG